MTAGIIGLSGYARSGKDTVAAILVEQYGYKRIAFADIMKEALYNLNCLVDPLEYKRVKDVVINDDWESAKQYDEIRFLLQNLGTEVGRKLFGENFWVEAAFGDTQPADKVVFSDCRFPNEAKIVQANSGSVWRMDRTGVKAANAHASESALDGWTFDHFIPNAGSLEDLEKWVHTTYAVTQEEWRKKVNYTP